MYVFLLATERKAIQKLQGEKKQIKKQLHQQNKTKKYGLSMNQMG